MLSIIESWAGFEMVSIALVKVNQETPLMFPLTPPYHRYYQYHSTQSVTMLPHILFPFVFFVALHIQFSFQEGGIKQSI